MQIRSVSELTPINVSYKSATSIPAALDGADKAFVETSYKISGNKYDSKKLDLYSILSSLYNSINALCTEISVLREKEIADVKTLSAGDPNSGICSYIELISELCSNNSRQHNALSAGDPSEGISGYITYIRATIDNTTDNFVLKRTPTGLTLILSGNFAFTDEIDGTIYTALTAKTATWN